MEIPERKSHWERIYESKLSNEMSWFQSKPYISLQFIEKLELPKTAKIIDIGGGDSCLVDFLIEDGFSDITVLDISENALEKAQQRLGLKGNTVKWMVADAATFSPSEKYDLWHDRAAFHFLTNEKEIQHYIGTVKQSLNPGGYLVLGTFSENGPEKCSGLSIKQYSELSMTRLFSDCFKKINCITDDHKTPTGGSQQFLYCCFQRTNI